jgi:DNA end-binding protein Ku
MVGLARVVLYRRERLLMLQPRGKGLMGTGLRYKSEVRLQDKYFDEIPEVKVPHDMLELAVHILKSKESHFDPEKFEDRYEHALVQLIKAKAAGKAPPKAAEPPPSNVVNLMDALRRSVQAERKGGAESKPVRSTSSRTSRSSSRASTSKKRTSGSRAKVKRAS